MNEVYLTDNGELAICTNGMGGLEWGAFRVAPGGGLHRIKSAKLPMVGDAYEAAAAFVKYAAAAGWQGIGHFDVWCDGEVYRLRLDDHNGPRIVKGSGKWGLHAKFDTRQACALAWFELWSRREIEGTEETRPDDAEPGVAVGAFLGAGNELDQARTQIETDYAQYQAIEQKATFLALRMGVTLMWVKGRLPHGKLSGWLGKNCPFSHRKANYYMSLADVFLKARQLDPHKAMALVAADVSRALQGNVDEVVQMAFDFVGDKTQSELLEEHGIRLRPPKPRGGDRGGGGGDAGQQARQMTYQARWRDLVAEIYEHAIKRKTHGYLTSEQLRNAYDLLGDVRDALKEVIKA